MNIRLGFLYVAGAAALGGCHVGAGTAVGDGLPAGNQAPTAAFTATPSSGSAPVTVQFDGTASADSDGTIATYAWDFGDGATLSGGSAVVSHEYLADGAYSASLTVTDNGGASSATTRAITLSAPSMAVWLGIYESSLIGESFLNTVIDRTATTLAGTYRDASGREGTLSGAITGGDVSLQLTATTPGCNGAFVATGVLDVIDGTDALFLEFTGTDCEGVHTEGFALLIRQQSEVLAWPQYEPAGLTQHNGEVFWTDNSDEPLKKVDVGTGEVTPLTSRLGPVSSVTQSGSRIVWTHGIGDLGDHCAGANVIRSLGTSNADGSNIRSIATGEYCSGLDGLARVLADDTHAYWVRTGSDGLDIIERVPFAGGNAEALAMPGPGFASMAIDASHLYWSEVVAGEASKILRCPFAGCGPEAPETILSTGDTLTSNIVLVGDEVAFGIWRSGQFGPEIAKMPKAGGAVTVIAHADEQITRVLADAGTVFYLTGNALLSVPIDGGAVTTVVPGFFYLQDIALGGNRVYWTDASFAGGFADGIYFADKSGGAIDMLAPARYAASLHIDANGDAIFADGTASGLESTGIHRASTTGAVSTLVSGLSGATAIAVDDQHVYAPQGFNIKQVGVDGGSADLIARTGFFPVGLDIDDAYVYWGEDPQNIVLRAPFDRSAPPSLVGAGNSGIAVDVVVRGEHAYWLGDPFSLFRAPVIGGEVQTLADNLQFVTNLLVDDEFVYLMEADAKILSKIPLAGGARTVVTTTAPFFGWYAMAQDAANLYWASPDGLFRVAKSGGTAFKYAELLVSVNTESIAVDDQYLYWTEGALGAIKRRPK